MRYLSLLTLLILAGCAGSQTATAPEADEQPTYERLVDPFPIYDADGDRYAHPFLGGLDVPRPQLTDIDADGDADLFLQERTGEVIFFENTGTDTDASFTWRTDRYQDLDVGEWYRFADLDQDGDPDLLAEQRYSYIQYFRNTGTPSDPNFEQVVDTLRSVDGEPIFSDRQNIPNVTDVDCDGMMDLFLGRLDGTITRYESVGSENGVPRFRHVTDRFQDIEIVGDLAEPGARPGGRPGFPGGPSANLHGANTMLFADVDSDGDLDLLWGDFFEPSVLLIENTGSCQTPIFRGEPRPFPLPDPPQTSGYNAPTIADIDGDEDQDLFIGVLGGAFNPSRTAQGNFYFYEQLGPERYELRTRRFLTTIDLGSESYVDVADLNGDDQPDLLVSNKIAPWSEEESSAIVLYMNRGTTDAPEYAPADTLQFVPSFHYAPEAGDLDADGDLDLLVGTWNDGIMFVRNAGGSGAGFELEEEAFVSLSRGSHAAPALGDLDADGDLDLLVGETSGTINFFRNVGGPQAPAFELVTDALAGIDVGRRSTPTLLDTDGDGDLDLVVGSEQEGMLLFRNTGTPTAPQFEAAGAFPVDAPELATPAFGDVDGDGEVELFSGGRSGGVFFFRK